MTLTAPRLAMLAVSAVALLVSGCGSSSDDDAAASSAEATTTTGTISATSSDSAGDDPLCGPLKVISDKDAETRPAVERGWPATQEFLVANTDEVLAAYDDAIALDTDLTADLQALRTFTEQTATVAAESGSFEEFSNKLLAQEGVTEAGQAGVRLNAFAEDTCGFSTTSNGG